jgi:hypothetical protein
MKLSLISENSSGVVAYHLSTEELLPQILRQGLKPGAPQISKWNKPGFGTYVFFASPDRALQTAKNMIEWLGNDRPALIQTVVSSDQLLIDEDALDDESNQNAIDLLHNDKVLEHFPPESVDELMQWVNSRRANKETLINIIDKYQIRPLPMFKVYMGRYSFETARSTEPVLPVNKVWVLGKNHEWVDHL